MTTTIEWTDEATVADIHPDDIPVVERILTDCADMAANGVDIRRGEWGISHVDGVWYFDSRRACCGVWYFDSRRACCPGGAVIMAAKPRLPDHGKALSVLLGRSRRWVAGFVYGIDGEPYMAEPSELRGYAAGLVVAAALWGEK